MTKRTLRLLAAILTLTVLAFSLASCAGKFSLTHKLLNWNLSLNKWLGSFVLFLFIVVPVYGVCLLVDWVVLNVIEFYSGHNPVSSTEPLTRTATVDGLTVTMTMYPGKGVNLDLTTTDAAGASRTMVVRTTADGVNATVIENGKASCITARPGANDTVERCVENKCRSFAPEEQSEMLEQIAGMDELLAAAE